VNGVRVHSLVEFRQCLASELAAAFDNHNFPNAGQNQRQQKQRQMKMPAPSITNRFSGRKSSSSSSNRRSSSTPRARGSNHGASFEKDESDEAWCVTCLKFHGVYPWIVLCFGFSFLSAPSLAL